MLLPYVNLMMYMRYKENKSHMRVKIYSSSIFKREFKSHSNKTSKSRPIYRDISCDLQVWSERYDIIYAETGEYAKRITQRGASHRWWGRGYKKCSGITSNFHWSRQNGYRTCTKISYDDRFRQVLCVYVYVCVCMCVCACVCVQIRNMQPQRATADNAFPTIFCAFCASMERTSLFSVFTFDFFLRSTRTRALCAGNKFDSLHLENIVTPRYTKPNEKFVLRKK